MTTRTLTTFPARWHHYWNVFWQCRKMYLLYLLEYRANFIFWTIVSTMWTLFNFFVVGMLGSVTNSIAGWTPTELRLLLGFFNMIDAIVWSFFYHNMITYTRQVFDGSLSTVLLKPVDPQFMLMTQHNSYSNIFRFLIGGAAVVVSLTELGWTFNLIQILAALIVLISVMTIFYCVWFMFSTLAFWVERLDNINDIIPVARELYRFPRQAFTGVWGFVFTMIIPIAFIATGPSEVLLGRQPSWLIPYLVIFALVAFWVSRRFFFFSLQKFSGIAN